MHISVLRGRLIAARAAASQLGPTFNFGGLSATASATCDASDMTTIAVLATKAIMVFSFAVACAPHRRSAAFSLPIVSAQAFAFTESAFSLPSIIAHYPSLIRGPRG